MNKTQKVRIETPVGVIESDSGSHLMDVTSVLIVVIFLFIAKKIVSRYIK